MYEWSYWVRHRLSCVLTHSAWSRVMMWWYHDITNAVSCNLKWKWWNCLTYIEFKYGHIQRSLFVCTKCVRVSCAAVCSVQCAGVGDSSPSVPQYLSCPQPTLYWPLSSGSNGWLGSLWWHPNTLLFRHLSCCMVRFILKMWLHKSCSHTLHVSALCLSLKGFLYNANIIRRGRYGDLNGVVMTGCWDLYVS